MFGHLFLWIVKIHYNCYPRLNKSRWCKSPVFKIDTVSQYYADRSDDTKWREIYEVKYLIRNDTLYSLSALEPGIYSDLFQFKDDAFLIKITKI